MPNLEFEALTAPITDLQDGIGEALAEWPWLVPAGAQPVLLTALGDLFIQLPDGSIHFLDTSSGTLAPVAPSYQAWKQSLEAKALSFWFRPAFVAELLEVHGALAAGQVFSPVIPPVLGGEQSVANYTPSHWLAHFHVCGQIHRQVKDLPSGTRITKIKVEPW
jgi:hypothetical protein